MTKIRGKYKPKEENIRKLLEFLNKIEKKQTENKTTNN
jgi:hypothetical protein